MSGISYIKADAIKESGAVIVTPTSITFLRGGLQKDVHATGQAAERLRIPFSDIASVGMQGDSSYWFWGFCAVVVKQTNGRVDWFAVPSKSYPGLMSRPDTEAAEQLLRSAVKASHP